MSEETNKALEERLRRDMPMYAEAKRIHTRMMLAGDDGSWAGETDLLRVVIYATAILAEELEKIKSGPPNAGVTISGSEADSTLP